MLQYVNTIQVFIVVILGMTPLFYGGIEREEREGRGKVCSKNKLQLVLMTYTWLDDYSLGLQVCLCYLAYFNPLFQSYAAVSQGYEISSYWAAVS